MLTKHNKACTKLYKSNGDKMKHKGIGRRTFLTYGALSSAALLVPKWALAESDVLEVEVLFTSPVTEVGWVKQHHQAAYALKDKYGDTVQISTVDNVYTPQDAERVFREFASTGHQLIFGTSFSHGTPIQRVAQRFPNVSFEHCAGIVQQKNVGIFEAKYFEGSYVAGAAAAMASKSERIGFLGAFPVPDIVGAANGFLLGAQSINPNITCTAMFLNSWFDPSAEKEAANSLISQGCDVICNMSNTVAANQVCAERGVWSVGYASNMEAFGGGKQLTAYMLDWGAIYETAAKQVIAGTWESTSRWDGLAAGIIKMAPYNDGLSADHIAQLKQIENDLASGAVQPFAGELRDQADTVRVAKGSVLSEEDTRHINWFVKGMVGQLA